MNITKDDFIGFYPKSRLCGQHGDKVNKAIDMLVDPVKKRMWYEVTDKNEVVYMGTDIDEAIKHFNEA